MCLWYHDVVRLRVVVVGFVISAAVACQPRARETAAPKRPDVITGRAPDFNRDGYADLAISAPGAQLEEIGRVFVYLGGAAGWRPAPSELIAGPDVVGASFGAGLATGDF